MFDILPSNLMSLNFVFALGSEISMEMRINIFYFFNEKKEDFSTFQYKILIFFRFDRFFLMKFRKICIITYFALEEFMAFFIKIDFCQNFALELLP